MYSIPIDTKFYSIPIDTIEIKIIIREYPEKLYDKILDIGEMEKLLKRHKLPKTDQRKNRKFD